jgi:hypothetical protein
MYVKPLTNPRYQCIPRCLTFIYSTFVHTRYIYLFPMAITTNTDKFFERNYVTGWALKLVRPLCLCVAQYEVYV